MMTKWKSNISETRMIPALTDIIIYHLSPAAVCHFRMGWKEPAIMPDRHTPH